MLEKYGLLSHPQWLKDECDFVRTQLADNKIQVCRGVWTRGIFCVVWRIFALEFLLCHRWRPCKSGW